MGIADRGLAVEYILYTLLAYSASDRNALRIADWGFPAELILLAVLAFAAAFRGWGAWPFVLLALPFAPALAHTWSGSDLLAYGMSSALSWLLMAGLFFMIVMGRAR